MIHACRSNTMGLFYVHAHFNCKDYYIIGIVPHCRLVRNTTYGQCHSHMMLTYNKFIVTYYRSSTFLFHVRYLKLVFKLRNSEVQSSRYNISPYIQKITQHSVYHGKHTSTIINIMPLVKIIFITPTI